MSTVDLAGMRWRKSSLSGGTTTALRDSKNATGPALVLPAAC